MDDKNRLNDGEKPQTPADREAKAKRRILVGIAAGALLVASLITGGIYLSGRAARPQLPAPAPRPANRSKSMARSPASTTGRSPTRRYITTR